MAQRTFKGVVVSTAMQKTIVVRVDRMAAHPKYKKRYTISKRFKVHAPEGDYRIGDVVEFYETRPLSKTKRWSIVHNKGKGDRV